MGRTELNGLQRGTIALTVAATSAMAIAVTDELQTRPILATGLVVIGLAITRAFQGWHELSLDKSP
jgi:hypothetical protein